MFRRIAHNLFAWISYCKKRLTWFLTTRFRLQRIKEAHPSWNSKYCRLGSHWMLYNADCADTFIHSTANVPSGSISPHLLVNSGLYNIRAARNHLPPTHIGICSISLTTTRSLNFPLLKPWQSRDVVRCFAHHWNPSWMAQKIIIIHGAILSQEAIVL